VLILALDTATDQGSLALVEGETLLAEDFLESAGTYLSRLLPGVAALFAAAGREPADLGAVGVSLGPGNFTGLRIGIATAKALAWSLGCPLVPVPTMEVLAAQCPFQPQPIGVILDAKRNEVFWGVYRCPAERPEVVAGPVRLPLAELACRLTPPLVLTGPGVEILAAFIQGPCSEGITLAPPERRYPRAATLASLALSRLEAGLTASPQQLAPTYLRPAL
jgi:tRNA threonylcarbamoyladenosine biosynthesis protein TsaB